MWEVCVGNIQIDTPARRRKLPEAKAPVWVSIGQARSGLKLGYRKGPRGGVWVAKHVGKGTRRECTIGAADDAGAPEGALSFTAATQAAIAWADGVKAQAASGGATTAVTVKQAVDSYVTMRVARSARAGADGRSRLSKHVLRDKLAGMALSNLSATALTDWRKRLDPELAPATVNRTLNDLRAALSRAVDEYWRLLPPSLPREIEHGMKSIPEASQARAIILPDADVRTVVDAAFTVDVDFGVLVLLLAATGMRFSQIAAMTVADVQPAASRVMVPPSRKGRAVKPKPRIAIPVGDDVLGHLQPLLAGRRGHEPLLWHWVQKWLTPRNGSAFGVPRGGTLPTCSATGKKR
ncbi:hypothetical protein BOSEA31B_10938 [Hyphomicrobiales bacterium]|nr:hypothetical protein BOSEA31B_10938 [Hyphomicrobiales bacterium]CAH1700789.1 hypothetical protein BOSEA1005_20488 [Hyphomicrobiales bacterium]CAI0344662.1 hypothetical protein BO1005MUT1_350029 [Hyphomicrobiales bacterium]